ANAVLGSARSDCVCLGSILRLNVLDQPDLRLKEELGCGASSRNAVSAPDFPRSDTRPSRLEPAWKTGGCGVGSLPGHEGNWTHSAVPPPHNVVINQNQLVWNSTAINVTFTVEYRSFNSDWTPIPACSNTPLTSCDFGLGRAEAEYGCVRVRVAARTNGETSESVEACSREGDPCTPNVTLTAAPGSLTVNLKREHDLDKEHASNLKHQIYLGKKGGKLEWYKDSVSSEFIDGLEVGQQYCVTVGFVLHWKPLGPASCVQCETIPGFSKILLFTCPDHPRSCGSKQTQIIVVSIVISGIFLLVGIAYIQLFKSRKIKQLLQPPYTIPSVRASFTLTNRKIRKEFELPADLLFQRTDGDYWDQGEDWILPEIPTKSEESLISKLSQGDRSIRGRKTLQMAGFLGNFRWPECEWFDWAERRNALFGLQVRSNGEPVGLNGEPSCCLHLLQPFILFLPLCHCGVCK
ncbi:hypothetical protein XENOCAPTIV_018513, partial [Xenoophorus captivus]